MILFFSLSLFQDDRLDNNEAIENENGLEIYDKKYIPNSLDDRITTK
jgi:hypothetical protein